MDIHPFEAGMMKVTAARGRLDAQQRSDGQWLSTRKAVEKYKKSRDRRGRRRSGDDH